MFVVGLELNAERYGWSGDSSAQRAAVRAGAAANPALLSAALSFLVCAIDDLYGNPGAFDDQGPVIFGDAVAKPLVNGINSDLMVGSSAGFRDSGCAARKADEFTNIHGAIVWKKFPLCKPKISSYVEPGTCRAHSMCLATTLQGLMDSRDVSRQTLAHATGVPIETINKWLQGKVTHPHRGHLKKVADYFDVTSRELVYGIIEARLKDVPLLGISKLGTLKRGQSPHVVGDPASRAQAPFSLGDQAFAVVLEDDACAPEFPAGSIIFCDPDTPYRPNDFVLAVIEKLQRAVFRRYERDSETDLSRFTLRATKVGHPPISVPADGPGFIIGRAVKQIRDI